ncbi:hypothetical protein B0H11DRAFT_2362421 [Mycena galericulata]|nr:hypothetical protein B0H11DRAFT_2362421 [Mycena galericulata]
MFFTVLPFVSLAFLLSPPRWLSDELLVPKLWSLTSTLFREVIFTRGTTEPARIVAGLPLEAALKPAIGVVLVLRGCGLPSKYSTIFGEGNLKGSKTMASDPPLGTVKDTCAQSGQADFFGCLINTALIFGIRITAQLLQELTKPSEANTLVISPHLFVRAMNSFWHSDIFHPEPTEKTLSRRPHSLPVRLSASPWMLSGDFVYIKEFVKNRCARWTR